MPQGFSMGGTVAHGTEMIGGGNFENFGPGPQLNSNNDDFGGNQNLGLQH